MKWWLWTLLVCEGWVDGRNAGGGVSWEAQRGAAHEAGGWREREEQGRREETTRGESTGFCE